jgi:ferredoxin-NADP reductase
VLVRGGVDGDVRPYTPITQGTPGEFDLLVKVYPDGTVSKWLGELQVGAEAEFKHIKFNLKIQCVNHHPSCPA